jgi:peptidoglycan/xylan/chitin deacetylase (PgdA/CDA1 family)
MTMRFGRAALVLLIVAAALAWAATAPAVADEVRAAILLYHRFDPDHAPKATTVTTETFENQLNWLAGHGYKVAPLSAVVAALNGGGPIEPRTVAITVDDGYRSQYTDMYPIILRHGIPVTLFVVAHAISAENDVLTWEEIDEMAKSDLVDVQSHTNTHPHFFHQRARKRPADYQAFVNLELSGSKATLEQRLKRPISYLAWPYGDVDADLKRAASAAGYCAAFAVAGRQARAGDDPFALPRIVVRDADRGERFDRLINLGGTMAAAAPPATCAAPR